nr:uncharacterized protein LOC123767477 [Procambarus clarkii]
MNTFILFSLLCLVVARCSGLSCVPCNPNDCQDPATLNCSWGTVREACSCCETCGGGPGAVCGGPWDIKGKCGSCLVCNKKTADADGICVPVKSHRACKTSTTVYRCVPSYPYKTELLTSFEVTLVIIMKSSSLMLMDCARTPPDCLELCRSVVSRSLHQTGARVNIAAGDHTEHCEATLTLADVNSQDSVTPNTMNTFTVSLLCLVVASCSGLKCVPCDPNTCQDPATLNCSWGTVIDACKCCEICGGGPGAVCGGPFDIRGKCGRSLVCDKEGEYGDGICVPAKSHRA